MHYRSTIGAHVVDVSEKLVSTVIWQPELAPSASSRLASVALSDVACSTSWVVAVAVGVVVVVVVVVKQ